MNEFVMALGWLGLFAPMALGAIGSVIGCALAGQAAIGAMLDVPVESSQANSALLFEAFTDQIPPKGTLVTVVLTPRVKDLEPNRGGDPKADTFVVRKVEKDENK